MTSKTIYYNASILLWHSWLLPEKTASVPGPEVETWVSNRIDHPIPSRAIAEIDSVSIFYLSTAIARRALWGLWLEELTSCCDYFLSLLHIWLILQAVQDHALGIIIHHLLVTLSFLCNEGGDPGKM